MPVFGKVGTILVKEQDPVFVLACFDSVLFELIALQLIATSQNKLSDYHPLIFKFYVSLFLLLFLFNSSMIL